MNTILVIGVAILIFIIFREVITWYWKINKIVSLLEQIERNTRVTVVEEKSLAGSVPKEQPTGSVWRDGKWGDK
jgi:hypothetical protein